MKDQESDAGHKRAVRLFLAQKSFKNFSIACPGELAKRLAEVDRAFQVGEEGRRLGSISNGGFHVHGMRGFRVHGQVCLKFSTEGFVPNAIIESF